MDNNYRNTNLENIEYVNIIGENKLLRSAFAWMGLAMLLTTLAAYLFAEVPLLTSMLINTDADGMAHISVFGYAVMLAPLLFVLGIRFAFNRLSYPALIGLFVAYAAVNGVSLSFIFNYYELGSVVTVFFSTAALFAIMAIAGYTTKTDLSKLGTLLMIGVLGIIVASIINLFAESSGLEYLISIAGVIIFTGLTAYDVQKIKELGYQTDGSLMSRKLGIVGALQLYLDFVNMFLFLLRLFGQQRN